MRAPTLKRWSIRVAVTSIVLAAACTSTGGSPTGGGSAPVQPVFLKLGTGDPQGRPDTPVVERFAEAVERLSDGQIHVEIVWEAGGDSSRPHGFEEGVVRSVRKGDLDLGWIATRAWDTVGVRSFQALQAPFLVTDHALLNDVLASPTAHEMLSGLDEVGMVGLGLFPDGMRYPAGYARPMTSPSDFDGAAIRLVPSKATESLVRALGGRPVYGLTGAVRESAIASGELDGTEISLSLAPALLPKGSVITGNVVLFPRVNSLFASGQFMRSLSDEQRAILAAAAEEAQAFATDSVTERFDAYCDFGGLVAIASKTDVAALERAARPVYRTLEADPPTKAFIGQIQALKDAASHDGTIDVPASCLTH